MDRLVRYALAAVLLSTGCKSVKAGDPCSGDNQCSGSTAALVCVSGRYVATDCKGPDGCTKSPFRCDYRGNAAGDTCFEPAWPAAPMSCSADKKARFRCLKSKVDRDDCDGPKGCYAKTETTMLCDRTLRAGAACSADGDWCSSDGADWLQCREGKLVIAAKCRGRLRCKPMTDAIACDTSVGEVNDPCVGKARACSGDGKLVVECRDNSLQVATTCAAGKVCTPSAAEPACN